MRVQGGGGGAVGARTVACDRDPARSPPITSRLGNPDTSWTVLDTAAGVLDDMAGVPDDMQSVPD
ncbi:hypothetical protein EUX98_g8865 [Antrodiella citrinella]|uniref:Uncharacterized protein n=1 Tax=Antrodiella citrinella TaxID=2447956 RepID=A0A4S4M374_9APHY|nr:hypothetical protein EUX98_g8865 [Antrodiella citrinella]